jgi:prepilin-type N-terminal cleavage/methylation domain-containing protein/prepilin-type processing-associated H-X9-DG protein
MNKSLRNNSTHRSRFPGRFYKSRFDQSANGFTLVELVVVLASIAVLAATLIPALASARPNSRAFQCMNNLRQWGAAFRTMAGDNNDMMARDGTDNNGSYAAYTFATTGPGSPNDSYAWFNVVPPAMGEQPLSYYYHLPGANGPKKYPFPGNGTGKIWLCPSAIAAPADTNVTSGTSFLNLGAYGLFSYVMNIDLKLNSNIANGIIGNSAVYPNMPRFGAIRNPAAVVLFTDAVFSPTLETFVLNPSGNGILPSGRWSVFPKRHNNGGTLVFTDGHSAILKWDYVFNQNPTPTSRNEKLNPDVWWNPNRDIP